MAQRNLMEKADFRCTMNRAVSEIVGAIKERGKVRLLLGYDVTLAAFGLCVVLFVLFCSCCYDVVWLAPRCSSTMKSKLLFRIVLILFPSFPHFVWCS